MASLQAPESIEVFADLERAYAEPHRHYHTTTHISNCLCELDGAASLIDAPAEVEVALWFHDAVYTPASSTNELESAQWARQFLKSIDVDETSCERVFDYIMATKHSALPSGNDVMFVVDIDLSILGSPADTFRQFEENVRKEYRWVPWPLYRRKRIEILRSFLDSPSIYNTEYFRSRYENKAELNLQWAIEDLGK